MVALEFPRHRIALLEELGARLIDSRKVKSANEALARDLLAGFYDVCMRAGLDRVLDALAQAYPPFDIADRAALTDHPVLLPAVVAQLDTIDIDDGGPRNAKPKQLADRLAAALALTLIDEPERTITLGDDVRRDATAALASVIDVELAIPHVRETIIANARAQCEPRHHGSFDRIAAQLDERGMHIVKMPKVPIDAVQAIQRVLFDTRNAVVSRAANTAIDRAKEAIARADATAAARIDHPISLRLTPREVAILRACDQRVPKVPAAIVPSLLEGLAELSGIVWRAPEKPVRAYAASQTFAVGDVLEHPKFGRGSVVSALGQRMEVEFADGKHTLVQARK